MASGALHASALSLLRKHLTPENAGELFELCTRRSARKVEELLAARFPRADVRDLVRRLPAQSGRTLDVGCDSEETSTEGPSPDASQETSIEQQKAFLDPSREASAAFGAPEASKPRRLEPLSADRYGVHFTADSEFRELLERVRGLAGHRLPSGDLMTLIKRGLEAYERELTKERFAVGRRPGRSRAATSAPSASDPPSPEPPTPEPPKPDTESKPNPNPNPNRKRHCPAAVARAVFLRDGQQCSYVSPDGRRCSARQCLELDHVEPWAVGGEGTIENLRLRCRAHNQRYARQCFGKSRVEAAVQHSRRRRAAAQRRGKAG
ncbi:MAG: HNH endonuclease signature motif containing protein [Pseudomonadota bacterium]